MWDIVRRVEDQQEQHQSTLRLADFEGKDGNHILYMND